MQRFRHYVSVAVAALTLLLSLTGAPARRAYAVSRGAVLRTDVIGPNVGYSLTVPWTDHVLVGHDSVAYTDPNTGLVIVDRNGISVLDSRTEDVVSNLKLPDPFTLDTTAFSPVPVLSRRTNTVYRPLLNASTRSVVGLLDARTGRLRGHTLVGDTINGLAVDDRSGHVFVAGVRPGYLKCTCPPPNGQVVMLDAQSGRVLRTTLVGEFPSGIAIDSVTGRVFVTNGNSDDVSVLDSVTGLLVRSVALPHTGVSHAEDVRPSLAMDDQSTGRVFVLGEGNKSLSVFDSATGALLSTAIVAQAHFLASLEVDSLAGRVYIADEPGGDAHGSIVVADARTGEFFGRLPSGTNPDRILVDHAAGRLFVSTASSVQGPDDQITVVSTHTDTILCTIALDVNQGIGGDMPLNGFLALDNTRQRLFASAGNTIVMLNGAFNPTSCLG